MKPDKPKTTYTMMLEPETKTPPRVIFGTTALRWIHALVDIHSQEVGFYAIVDTRENYTFFVRDVFYPKHSEANGATCEISPEGETDMITWMCDHGKEDDIAKVRLWGHSHHNMHTSPSGQDENQAKERIEATQAFLIRVICNKDGEMSLSFFDYDNRIRFDHVKWEAEDDLDESFQDAKIEEINAVMADPEKSPVEKIKAVNEITIKDTQTTSIREKVKELKAINIPKSPPGYVKNRGVGEHNYQGPGYQGKLNLFKNEKEKSATTTSPRITHEEELEEGFQNSIEQPDSFEKGQIDTMLKHWEENVSIGEG